MKLSVLLLKIICLIFQILKIYLNCYYLSFNSDSNIFKHVKKFTNIKDKSKRFKINFKFI